MNSKINKLIKYKRMYRRLKKQNKNKLKNKKRI